MPENPNADPETGSEYFYGANITMTTNANNNNINQNININNRKQVPRVSSAGLKYYDIATQLLGKKGSDIEELFIAAARDGVYERLENFLQRNRSEYVISIDVKDKKTGNTPLIWAAKRGHAKIVQLLLRHGADLTLRNYEGQTALEVASPSIRSILLESVERGTEASHHLLLQAAWQGDIKVVSRLLSQKKVLDINCQNADGFTPVMLATRDMVFFEKLSSQMSRPYNPVEVVSELLSARADLHAADEDGKTCLHHASQSKATIAPSVVASIISGGPNLECKDKRSFTSVHCASLNGNAECISTLLHGGSEVNARGFAGATPLHITSYNNHERATDVLLEFGANVAATDDRGLTPLDFAKTRRMKKKLQEAWAEVVSSKSTTSLGPVRAPSREDLRSSVEDLTKKRKGEVIFEGLPSNPFSDGKKDPVSRSRGLTRHSSLKDKNGKGEEENGMHIRDPVRKLGQVRNQKPAPLPRGKSRSTERLPAISPDRISLDRNLESPVHFNRTARSRRSFEDKRQGRKPAPLPTREGSSMGEESLDRPTPRHARSESDPNRSTPNLLDIAASCETFMQNGNRRGRSYSVNSPNFANNPDNQHQNSPLQREATVTPVQREATLMSVCSYRSDSRMSTNSNSPRLLNLGQMLCKPKTPVHNFPFGPTSNKVIPPTPTFLTQRQFSTVDAKSEYDHSPRSDDDDPFNDLQRSRTIFKDEFVLEDSRPKDPFMQSSSSSGTDTLSSSSSSRYSSPRETQTSTNAKTVTQSKNIKVGKKGSVKQSQNGSKTSSNHIDVSVSSKPMKLNEKSVPMVKVNGTALNRNGSSSQVQKESNSVPNTKADTSVLHAMAMRNAAVLNVKPNTAQGAKSGGTILIHGDAKEISNKSPSETVADVSKVKTDTENATKVNNDSAKSNAIATSRQEIKEDVTEKSNISPTVGKEKSESTATKSQKPANSQKRAGTSQKLSGVMQVVPTKLTQNIIRTAPKQGKDKVDEKSAVKTVSSKNTYAKGAPSVENETVGMSNVNMHLSATAEVTKRVANSSNQAVKKDDKVEQSVDVKTADVKISTSTNTGSKIKVVPVKSPNRAESVVQTTKTAGSSNTNAAASSSTETVGSSNTNVIEKSYNKNNVVNKTTLSAKDIASKTNESTNQTQNKTQSQTSVQGPPQTNTTKSETQQGSSQTNKVEQNSGQSKSRQGLQSRNVNMKVTRSAGANQRQMGYVRKTSSGYTPRFVSTAAQKASVNTKTDTSDKADMKVNRDVTVQSRVNAIDTDTKSENDKNTVKPQTVNSNSSSPTELVPASVCRTGSMSKSYNMAPGKNQLSKSVAISTSTKSEASSTTIVTSSKPSATALISSGSKSETSTVSKSLSQMPAAGAVSKDKTKTPGLLRSSSMSTIEESKEKEKQKMSSSDTKVHANNSTTQRPASDGPENKIKNSPLVEIMPDCAPRINKTNYVQSAVKIQTPVIVNPFAELEQKRENETKCVSASDFGFVVDKPSLERSKTQGSIKSRNGKKVASRDGKPSSANSRASSARRKKVKSKDANKSDTESRPRSGKGGKRVRSGKRKRKIPEASLAKENEKADIALIGGIGWHVATSCIDKSEADAVIVSQIDSSESESEDVDVLRMTSQLRLQIPVGTHMQLPNSLETPTSLSSPRFKEVRPSYDEKPKLPFMEDDGYPPMNLDMTQSSLTKQNRSGVIIDNNIPDDISEFLAKLRGGEDDTVFEDDEEDSDDDTDADYDNEDLDRSEASLENALHRDVIAGKLTPIPESPAQTHTSGSLTHVSKTVEAIMKFDRNIKEEDLNRWLGSTPRERKANSQKSDRSSVSTRNTSQRESSGSSRSTNFKGEGAPVSASSATARSQGSRVTSSKTNTSQTTAKSSEGKVKSEVTPVQKLTQNNSAKISNRIQRPLSKEQARRPNSRSNEKYEIQDKTFDTQSSRQSQADSDRSETKADNSKVDLKKILSEKMQSTIKMLEESNSVSKEARSAGKRQKPGDSLNDKAESGVKIGDIEEVNIKLDANTLNALDSDRKDDDLKSTRSSRKERKFSETKTHSFEKEDDIDEAIDEIMNNTFPSRSTLRSQLSYRSANSTLTEADRKVLRKMTQAQEQSPFYAKETEAKESARASTTYDESLTLNKANPEFLKRFHAEEFDMGRKVRAMIDAGADTARVEAMLKAEASGGQSKNAGKSDMEVKQLAKIMNSFRQMELYAGPGISHQRSSKKETPRRDGDYKSLSRFDHHSHAAGLPPRPGSAGAGRHRKEKFTEIKENSSTALTSQAQSASAVPKNLAEEFKRSPYVQVEGSYQGTQPALGVRGVSSESFDAESLERPDSSCTSLSSNSSLMEETIQWKKGNVLGKGAFGTVWCGLTSEGQLIAVKQIELNVTNQQKAKKEYEKVQEEVELLKTLEHKNIVGYLGTSLEDSIVSIFMQFVPGGSIASVLARFGALDESVFRKYTRQILEGVEYLHSNDVIHRDIKGGNVMLMPNAVIKLIDFGCAKRLCINLSMGQSEILKSMKGTPYWMAPEVVNETGHGKKSDIWSIGCTVFEMATRKPPWADMNPMAAIFAIGSDRPVPQLPEKFSEEARDFVNCCLRRDQNKRMSAAELLQTVFIRRRMKRSTTSIS